MRLLDLLVVQKDDEGEIKVHQQSDLDKDEAMEFGAYIGALIGLGTGDLETAERRPPVRLRSRTVMRSTRTRSGTRPTRSRMEARPGALIEHPLGDPAPR